MFISTINNYDQFHNYLILPHLIEINLPQGMVGDREINNLLY